MLIVVRRELVLGKRSVREEELSFIKELSR
jgi:hypothetical protein